MLHVIVEYRVSEEGAEKSRAAMEEFAKEVMGNEHGVLTYQTHIEKDGRSFVNLITFKDEAAEEIHRNSIHMLTLIKKIGPVLEKRPVNRFLTLIHSHTKT